MNIFYLLGYSTAVEYSKNTKDYVGKYIYVPTSSSPPTSTNIYYGATPVTSVYFGSTQLTSVYIGGVQIF